MAEGRDWSVPDWQRERPRRLWDPSRRLVRAIRAYQSAGAGPLGALRRFRAKVSHRLWSVVTQAEVELVTEIGGGLMMPHPNGIVIHPDAKIGVNCLLFQQVTLGTVHSRPGAPTLGTHVDVGAGARLLGPITIGDHAVIGANAVVLQDVPAYGIAVGVPARISVRASNP